MTMKGWVTGLAGNGQVRAGLAGLLALALVVPLAASAQDNDPYTDEVAFVDHLHDLQADLAWMQEHKKPMMVFFNASYCGYCRQIDDEFIIPMRLSPKYRGKLLIRRVQIDGERQYLGVDGKRHEPVELANRLEVRGVPYVLFFAPNGQRLGEITGTAPNFYNIYLERNVERAARCAKDMSGTDCQQEADQPGLL